MKNNGDLIQFVKQKDYIMVNNNLGEGSFGKTVLLQDPFINELFVAKKYEPECEEIKERFYNNFLDEICILYKLNHKNIVRIYNYYAYEEICTGYILMEYIEGDNIDEFIKKYYVQEEMAPPVSLDDIFVQLIDGFSYIEGHKIVHRDIREGNIIIDKTGTVKIIDFGIGKIFEPIEGNQDSLIGEINRANSDTLPQEYYDGTYTTRTDMFYLAELFNRLLDSVVNIDIWDFSYKNILDKMMEKQPEDRYTSFMEIKEEIGKHDFMTLDISSDDKKIYQNFVSKLDESIICFLDEKKFNYDTNSFITKLEKVLKNNCFEDFIQNKVEFINSIIAGGYRYNTNIPIYCEIVKNFLDWFKQSTKQSQKLILSNIISRLSLIKVVESEPDIPF